MAAKVALLNVTHAFRERCSYLNLRTFFLLVCAKNHVLNFKLLFFPAPSPSREKDDRRTRKRSTKPETQARRFVCGEYKLRDRKNLCNCGKSYAYAPGLFRHLKQKQLNGKKFRCPRKGCNKGYVRIDDIGRHLRCDHEKKRYLCEEQGCWKTFKYSHDLAKHRRK